MHGVDLQDECLSSQLHVTFLLGFLVTGCGDLIAPEHAWHKRSGNVATVGCEHRNNTWHLKCDGSKWDGVVGSCNASGKLCDATFSLSL